MVYLIARDCNKIGCIAIQTKLGDSLTKLKQRLLSEIQDNRIEVLIISKPEVFCEYGPYHTLTSEESFLSTVKEVYCTKG